MLNLVQRLCSN